MAAQNARNYKFAGVLFFAASAMFFFTENSALGATFVALGAAFIALAAKEGKGE